MDKIERNFIIFIFILSGIIFGFTLWLLNLEKPKYIMPLPKREETTQELLERLTPKEKREVNEKETNKLLESLTPKNPAPEAKDTGKLLESLTPK
jgi:hypothetical protein